MTKDTVANLWLDTEICNAIRDLSDTSVECVELEKDVKISIWTHRARSSAARALI